MLYVEFVNDTQMQELITDLICISDSFTDLKENEFDFVIQENIEKLESCKFYEEQKQLKQLYEQANDDETEALKVQMQLRDKLNKLKTGENK